MHVAAGLLSLHISRASSHCADLVLLPKALGAASCMCSRASSCHDGASKAAATSRLCPWGDIVPPARTSYRWAPQPSSHSTGYRSKSLTGIPPAGVAGRLTIVSLDTVLTASSLCSLQALRDLLLLANPTFDQDELQHLSATQLRDQLLAVDPLNTQWVMQINRVRLGYATWACIAGHGLPCRQLSEAHVALYIVMPPCSLHTASEWQLDAFTSHRGLSHHPVGHADQQSEPLLVGSCLRELECCWLTLSSHIEGLLLGNAALERVCWAYGTSLNDALLARLHRILCSCSHCWRCGRSSCPKVQAEQSSALLCSSATVLHLISSLLWLLMAQAWSCTLRWL